MPRVRAIGWVALACTLGCSSKMDIHVIRYPETRDLASRGEACDVRLFEDDASLTSDCRDVGDVFVGLLLPIAKAMVYDATIESFHALNAALAARAARPASP